MLLCNHFVILAGKKIEKHKSNINRRGNAPFIKDVDRYDESFDFRQDENWPRFCWAKLFCVVAAQKSDFLVQLNIQFAWLLRGEPEIVFDFQDPLVSLVEIRRFRSLVGVRCPACAQVLSDAHYFDDMERAQVRHQRTSTTLLTTKNNAHLFSLEKLPLLFPTWQIIWNNELHFPPTGD